ncbi:MAG: DUF411 domain-containing protein [Pseudomonadales bacterium]|nr:DUF411 domain-containing protein [Pseudomonadales bacterium]
MAGYSFLFVPVYAEESVWNKTDDSILNPLAITVYKNPTCGCCSDWVKHLKQYQFQVKTIDLANMSSIKRELGVPQHLQSCHTAVVNGYVIEGHVPAMDIRQLVEQKSPHLGLAVPHMPIGSPGMEMGEDKEPFKVIAFDKNGDTETVKEYNEESF